MVLDKTLFNQLRNFESDIARVNSLFKSNLGFDNPSFLWRKGEIVRTGFLDIEKKIEYSFHGTGCTVEVENKIISFDFDSTNNVCYTPFKFKIYLESINNDKEIDEKNIEAFFDQLLKENLLVEITGCGVRLK